MKIDLNTTPPSLQEINEYQRLTTRKARLQEFGAVFLALVALFGTANLDRLWFRYLQNIINAENVILTGFCVSLIFILPAFYLFNLWLVNGDRAATLSLLDPIERPRQCIEFIELGKKHQVIGAYCEKLKAMHRGPTIAEYQIAEAYAELEADKDKGHKAQCEFAIFEKP